MSNYPIGLSASTWAPFRASLRLLRVPLLMTVRLKGSA